MIAKAIAIGLFVISGFVSLYKAGKYASGGVDVHKGDSAAASSAVNFLLMLIMAIALYLDI